MRCRLRLPSPAHLALAGLALLPFAFGLPLLFGPIHIALLEMIIDPVCALVFEAEREERREVQEIHGEKEGKTNQLEFFQGGALS